jgi:CarD family transcriptional regulator
MALEFKKGDKVIYPNHGIGVVEEILDRHIGGSSQAFYSLRILANDSTVMVPVNNTSEVGLRSVASKREVDKLFRILRDGSIDTYGRCAPAAWWRSPRSTRI